MQGTRATCNYKVMVYLNECLKTAKPTFESKWQGSRHREDFVNAKRDNSELTPTILSVKHNCKIT